MKHVRNIIKRNKTQNLSNAKSDDINTNKKQKGMQEKIIRKQLFLQRVEKETLTSSKKDDHLLPTVSLLKTLEKWISEKQLKVPN